MRAKVLPEDRLRAAERFFGRQEPWTRIGAFFVEGQPAENGVVGVRASERLGHSSERVGSKPVVAVEEVDGFEVVLRLDELERPIACGRDSAVLLQVKHVKAWILRREALDSAERAVRRGVVDAENGEVAVRLTAKRIKTLREIALRVVDGQDDGDPKWLGRRSRGLRTFGVRFLGGQFGRHRCAFFF